MNDLALSELLSSRGFEGEGAERALERLHRDGLTRPRKTRIAAAKIEAVDRAFGAAFARHCRQPACLPSPGETREPVLVSAAHCWAATAPRDFRTVLRSVTGGGAELVTDDAKALRETLEAATGERVSALEGIGAADKALTEEMARGGEKERGRGLEVMLERPADLTLLRRASVRLVWSFNDIDRYTERNAGNGFQRAAWG